MGLPNSFIKARFVEWTLSISYSQLSCGCVQLLQSYISVVSLINVLLPCPASLVHVSFLMLSNKPQRVSETSDITVSRFNFA